MKKISGSTEDMLVPQGGGAGPITTIHIGEREEGNGYDKSPSVRATSDPSGIPYPSSFLP